MRGKLTLLVGVGVGYVLGTKAGRQRYEQIKRRASEAWNDPRVQAKADEAKHLAGEKVHQATDALKDKVSSSHGDNHGTDSGPMVPVQTSSTTAEPRPVP